jgi:A-macroglobulin TED domain
MVLGMLQASGDNIPAAAAKARGMLANGYKKLVAYEVSGGGFEWWGKKPAHAALTAYGLMQFTDMARVFDVDKDMVARTRTWLLGKRDGKGGFVTGGGRYGHFMGGSKEARSAYIAYSLLYAGESAANMQAEIGWLEKRAQSTDNAYELGVAACALAEANQPSAALARERLRKLQKKDGSLLGSGSITGSGERDLAVETTAFAVLAWLAGKGSNHDAAVQRAVQFLEKQRSGGGNFGGTQATVMALKALTSYLNANTRSVKPGKIKISLRGKVIAERELFGSEKRTIEFGQLARHLAIGDNELGIELTGGNEFPFSAELTYRADVPDSSKRCALDLRTYLTKRVIAEGGTTALHAVVSNTTNVVVGSPMILVGIPAGLHVDTKILDDLKKSETIAAWEMTDRTIVLYLRGLKANATRDITIDLVGRIPGTTKGPASRAYLYYAAREKKWTAPIEVTVTAAR